MIKQSWENKVKRLKLLLLPTGLLAITLLQGCAPLVLGGAATGISVAHDRRTVGVLVEDQNIELKTIGHLLDHPDLKQRLDVSATSYNLRVLLTGQAADEQSRDAYVKWVSHIPQVRRVYNEISVRPFRTLNEKATDAYLTAKINVALAKISGDGFDPTRVKVISEDGVVYLMGLLKESEEKAVEEAVRYVNGVKQVVKIIERI